DWLQLLDRDGTAAALIPVELSGHGNLLAHIRRSDACRLQLDAIRPAVLDHVVAGAIRILELTHHALGVDLLTVVRLLLRRQLGQRYRRGAAMGQPPTAGGQ